MLAIFRKEIQSFFSSPLGYVIIGLFLLLSSLFLWVFKGAFNLFDYGFADLTPFFLLAPWVFLFLIPALSMKSFSEEKSLGTLELLKIKPISTLQLVMGKFWGILVLCIFAILPTLIYVAAISNLGTTKGNFDSGVVLGSYFGLVFLMALYTAIGVFSSSITRNQILAFLLAVLLSFCFFYGFDAVSSLVSNGSTQRGIKEFGALYHFESIAKGVFKIQDSIYFVGLTLTFLLLTKLVIDGKLHKKAFLPILLTLFLTVTGAKFLDYRIDFTEDKRFTLSEQSKNSAKNLETPVIVDILLDGKLPPEFARLQDETLQLLEQFKAENNKISFNLINPLEGENQQQIVTELQNIGLTPANITTQENGKVSQELVFPWAMVNTGSRTVKVPLLKNKLGATTADRVNNSVQQLEYVFADAFSKLAITTKKQVAVIKGNNELEDIYLADFLTSIKDYYNIGAFTLDSVATNPQQTLEQLSKYDLALIAKPNNAFTDKEKYVLDQFIINGGKSIWLIDQVAMELDSLFNETGSNIATRINLNLNDFFFKYGVRINPVLVNDLYNTPIVLASGEDQSATYNPLPWPYHPMVFSKNNHPINTNIEAVQFQFANIIDTLTNTNKKTVLLESSPLSMAEGIPTEISLETISNPNPKEAYVGKGNLPLAVLIEGAFSSAFKNRIKPFQYSEAKEEGGLNKMILIADGDVIKNQIRNGQPLELGYDKWTNSFYGNKEFLMNSINYLLDDDQLINIRSKNVEIPMLDPQKISEQKTKWQLITILLPIVLSLVLGLTFNTIRKRKYAK